MPPEPGVRETSGRGARSSRHRLGPGRSEGRHPGRQARQACRRRRAPQPPRRRLDPYRDDPLEDPAPGHAGAARHAPARRARPDAASRRPNARRSSSCSTAPPRSWRPRPRSPASSSGATTSDCCPATRASRTTTRSTSTAPTSRSARERIVIAAGTRPARPASVEFDDRTIIDSDGLLKLESRVPRTMTVVGAGVIGVEYASMFGALGTKVTVVDQRDRVLSFLDAEIGEAFQYLLRRRNVTFRLREKVDAVEALQGRGARLKLASGKEIVSETVLYATGRQGDTERPRARQAPGSRPTSAGGSRSTTHYRTAVPHIFAVGDVRRRRRARRDRDGAGPDRRAARVRPAGDPAARADPDRRLRDPRARHGRPHRGAADRRRDPLRGRHRALERARPRRDDRRPRRHAQAARLVRGPAHPRRARARHERDRPGPHRPGRDGRRAPAGWTSS